MDGVCICARARVCACVCVCVCPHTLHVMHTYMMGVPLYSVPVSRRHMKQGKMC